MRDGSITLVDYDAQSLEVSRQVGAGLFMIRIDHLMTLREILFDDELDVDSAARDSDPSNSCDCFTHAMVTSRSREFPKSVLHADTIIVSCRLANFERTCWSAHRRHEFWEDLTKNWTQGQIATSLLAVSKRSFNMDNRLQKVRTVPTTTRA